MDSKTKPRRHPHVVNLDELELKSDSKGSKFGYSEKWVGEATGGKSIGCSYYEIPPGRQAFPHHYHCSNEESVFIIAGTGVARIGEERVSIRAGDYLAFPVGPEFPHSILNTGETSLRYLCMSTLNPVEVVGYVDSKKLGFSARSEGYHTGETWVTRRVWDGESLDYYAGETVD